MQTIFASGVATGRFAMGSSEALGEASHETIDIPKDAPTPAGPKDSESKNKAEGSGLGKRKRGAHDEDGVYMASFTDAAWGFVGAVQESNHSEGAPGIVGAVMGCPNFTKTQLMACLDYLMEHKSSALSFLDMDEEQKELWLRNHLAKTNFGG